MIKKDRAYVRVSSQKESQKDSPEHQESFIREVAAREGIEIDRVYEDRDTATSIVSRSDVQEMIEDAKRGEIKSIWFVSLSRFSRDTLDAISLKRILVNALKIRVVSIEDDYDSEKKDNELLFSIKSAVNQNTSGDIGISSKRGIRKSALEGGNIIASRAAFGYKKVTIGNRKTYEIVPELAGIVELIFNLYFDGLGDKSIVNYLNGENPKETPYPSPSGKEWGLSTVQSILKNPTYTGYNVAGRYASEIVYDDLTDLMNRRRKLVKMPESNWEWSKQPTHPAIIPLEKYHDAQKLRLERGGNLRGGRRKFINVFAKLIYCAECGAAMVVSTGKHDGKDKKYRYLICGKRRRTGAVGCTHKKWIPYEDFRDALIDNITDTVSKILNDFEVVGADEVGGTIPTINATKEKMKIERKIESNRKLLFEIRRQHILGEIDDDQYIFEKEQYEKEIAEFEIRLSTIVIEEQRTLDQEKFKSDSRKAIAQIKNIKDYSDNIEKTRHLLQQMVKRIEVSESGNVDIQTYYHLRD
jgi:hypothetical protein